MPGPSVPTAALQPLLEEARALRAEHDQRLAKQQDVTQLALAAVAALIAVVAALGKLSDADEALRTVRPLLPVISIILSGLWLMALEHDMNIAHIQQYLQEDLGPRIAAALGTADAVKGTEIWGWVAFRARAQQHAGRWAPATIGMAISKYVATALPNIGLLIVFVVVDGQGGWEDALSWVGFGLACVLVGSACVAATYASLGYLRLETDRPSDEGPP